MIQKQTKKLSLYISIDFRSLVKNKKDVNSVESFFEQLYINTKKSVEKMIELNIRAYKGFELIKDSIVYLVDNYGSPKVEFEIIENDEAHEKRLITEKKKIEEQRKKDLQTLKALIGKWDLKVDLPDEISNIEPKTRTRRKSAV